MASTNSNNDKIFQAYLKEIKRLNKFIEQQTRKGFIFPKSIIPETPKTITKSSVERLQKITPDKMFELATYKHPKTGEIVSGVIGKQIEAKTAKPKTKSQGKRDAFYSNTGLSGAGLRGGGNPPKKSDVTIQNIKETIDEISGKVGTPSNNVKVENVSSVDKQFLNETMNEIMNWQPLSNWTQGLADAKRDDRSRLLRILETAIETEGADNVARRMNEIASEISSLVQEILYASGSKEGNFKDGRTQVNFDLVRFASLMIGRPLTVDEAKTMAEEAEQMEYDDEE